MITAVKSFVVSAFGLTLNSISGKATSDAAPLNTSGTAGTALKNFTVGY
jgi:hypothetical protein